MSQQQINLYPGTVRTAMVFPAFAHLGLALALLLLVVLVTWGGLSFSQGRLRRQVAAEEQQLARQQQELETLQAAMQRPPDAQLQQQLEHHRQDLSRGEEVRLQLARLAENEQTGFAPQLEALARQTLAGLWLEQILLTDGGGVRLTGRSRNAEQVPLYLQGLSRQEVFRGTEFSDVQLRHDQEAGSYQFRVDNTGEETK